MWTERLPIPSAMVTAFGAESVAWFDVIAAGDVVPDKKPAPDIYQYVLGEMDLPSAECVAFEDSGNGLLSSMQAGLKTIVTVNGYTLHDNFDGALIVLDHLGEPQSPFTLIKGKAGGATFLDVPMVKCLFEA